MYMNSKVNAECQSRSNVRSTLPEVHYRSLLQLVLFYFLLLRTLNYLTVTLNTSTPQFSRTTIACNTHLPPCTKFHEHRNNPLQHEQPVIDGYEIAWAWIGHNIMRSSTGCIQQVQSVLFTASLYPSLCYNRMFYTLSHTPLERSLIDLKIPSCICWCKSWRLTLTWHLSGLLVITNLCVVKRKEDNEYGCRVSVRGDKLGNKTSKKSH